MSELAGRFEGNNEGFVDRENWMRPLKRSYWGSGIGYSMQMGEEVGKVTTSGMNWGKSIGIWRRRRAFRLRCVGGGDEWAGRECFEGDGSDRGTLFNRWIHLGIILRVRS